jgi:hypothetical protein
VGAAAALTLGGAEGALSLGLALAAAVELATALAAAFAEPLPGAPELGSEQADVSEATMSEEKSAASEVVGFTDRRVPAPRSRAQRGFACPTHTLVRHAPP